MALPFTEQDWFIFVQGETENMYDHIVIRGPVSTQILQRRLQRILDSRSLETAVLFYESIKIIIFQQQLNAEQIAVLQGDSS